MRLVHAFLALHYLGRWQSALTRRLKGPEVEVKACASIVSCLKSVIRTHHSQVTLLQLYVLPSIRRAKRNKSYSYTTLLYPGMAWHGMAWCTVQHRTGGQMECGDGESVNFFSRGVGTWERRRRSQCALTDLMPRLALYGQVLPPFCQTAPSTRRLIGWPQCIEAF